MYAPRDTIFRSSDRKKTNRQISSSNRYHEKFTRHYTWTPNIEPALESTLRRWPYRLDAIYYVTSLRKPSPIWT